jgi:hypothetical protein
VQNNDYIFPTSTAVIEFEATSLRRIRNEQDIKIKYLEDRIEEYLILLKFSQCYNHSGQTVILRRLKQMNPPDSPIQNWDFCKNCTQYLGNFDDRNPEQTTLQQQIYAIVQEYGIDRTTWNAIFKLNNRHNDQVHVPITEADTTWLKNNSSKYEQFERPSWRSNFVNAVTKLANALCRPNRERRFAQPHETSLNRYLNSRR